MEVVVVATVAVVVEEEIEKYELINAAKQCELHQA